MIVSFSFYPNYTRFAQDKLQLSYYSATLWLKGLQNTYLNLLRPSGYLGPRYCAALDIMSQRFYRANLSQTLNLSTALESKHSRVATHYTP